jgi:exodeoxyribonuclease VII small subunit
MGKKSRSEATGKPRATFEQSLEQVERIVDKLEDGETGLEESMKLYEQAVGLLRECQAILERAERQVSILVGTDDHGQPVTEPFEGESEQTHSMADVGQRKAMSKPKRATSSGKLRSSETVDDGDMDASGRLF